MFEKLREALHQYAVNVFADDTLRKAFQSAGITEPADLETLFAPENYEELKRIAQNVQMVGNLLLVLRLMERAKDKKDFEALRGLVSLLKVPNQQNVVSINAQNQTTGVPAAADRISQEMLTLQRSDQSKAIVALAQELAAKVGAGIAQVESNPDAGNPNS